MDGLSRADYRAILDLLKDVSSLQSFDDFAGKLLAGLHRIVDVDSAACMECGPGEEDRQIRFSVPEMSHFASQYSLHQRLIYDHPGWGYLLSTGGGRWYSVSDFLTEAHYHRTGLYNELYRDMKIEDNFGTLSMIAPATMVAISVHRDRRTFNDRDRQVLNLMQPHLIQAWRNNKLTHDLHRQIGAYEVALESRRDGIVVLDAKRRVRLMSARALRYVEKYFGRLATDDRLPKKLDAWVCYQENSLQAGQLSVPQGPLTIAGNEDSQLTVTRVPDRDGVTLIMQEQVQALSADLGILGLSRRESDVLLWVARGKSNGEVGAILSISIGTVKKHLEHIFQKLGVESRSAAAARALDVSRGIWAPTES